MTTSERHSLWLDPALINGEHNPERAPLETDTSVDVAIIGGGIAGLTTAITLIEDGASVAVLEAGRVGHGVTGCTTGKASALQGTIYSTIESEHNAEAAQTYAQASQEAVARIAELAARHGIDCDLARRVAYTYAAEESERPAIERELKAAAAAGLDVAADDGTDLPYPVHGAVALADQLEIHPVRYVRGLAAAVERGGGTVYEHTPVTGIREHRAGADLSTAAGQTVTAGHVVVASHYPLFDRGLYFALLEPRRSYCIAARLASGEPSRDLSISAGSTTRSVRSYKDLLIVGGEGHAAGSPAATLERFENLERFAREHWDIAEVTHRWSAQDPVPYDRLPFIGAYHPAARRVWVSTGFLKWGITSATFGASLLADAIAGRANPMAATFSPQRLSLRSSPRIARTGAKFSADFVVDRVRRAPSAADIGTNEGGVVRHHRRRIAVYRDAGGTAHAVSARCTHLGCLVRFNAAETSWDCPCHGSRFDIDGTVLEGPAVQPLQKYDLDT